MIQIRWLTKDGFCRDTTNHEDIIFNEALEIVKQKHNVQKTDDLSLIYLLQKRYVRLNDKIIAEIIDFGG